MTSPAEHAVVTLWFVSTVDAHALLAANPQPDEDYGLHLVAGLFPDKPVTPLGTFPLTRSAPAGRTEVYVGAYPGVTVLQTAAIPVTTMADLVPNWVEPTAAEDIYAFAQGASGAFAGFAHWHHGGLERAFTATTGEILEDTGLPLTVEKPYWAGDYLVPPEVAHSFASSIPLPFLPGDMLLAVYAAWLGFAPRAHHLNIVVNGFALDGRPEVRPLARNTSNGEHTLSSPEMGGGVSAAELAAAEVEEATGEVSEDGEMSVGGTASAGSTVSGGEEKTPIGRGGFGSIIRWWRSARARKTPPPPPLPH